MRAFLVFLSRSEFHRGNSESASSQILGKIWSKSHRRVKGGRERCRRAKEWRRNRGFVLRVGQSCKTGSLVSKPDLPRT
ncbi:hypothetical protein I3843_05G055900 [Carya illinoinensis]|nr:hypothetical protein I3843_05G055900 [Carya illinoinensis]